jgi:hypothetical protein
MRKHIPIAVGAILAVVVFGCEQKDETKTPPAQTSTEGTIPAKDATADASNKATDAAQTAKENIAGASAAAKDATNATAAEAQAKLDQVMQYIKENKIDLAEKTLSGLEQMKDSLPEAIQNQLASARSALNAAKATGTPPGPG